MPLKLTNDQNINYVLSSSTNLNNITAGELRICNHVSSGTYMTINTDGNVGIGSTNPNYKLHVEGDINFTGNLLKDGSEYGGGGGVTSDWIKSGNNISYTSGSVSTTTFSSSNIEATTISTGTLIADTYSGGNISVSGTLRMNNVDVIDTFTPISVELTPTMVTQVFSGSVYVVRFTNVTNNFWDTTTFSSQNGDINISNGYLRYTGPSYYNVTINVTFTASSYAEFYFGIYGGNTLNQVNGSGNLTATFSTDLISGNSYSLILVNYSDVSNFNWSYSVPFTGNRLLIDKVGIGSIQPDTYKLELDSDSAAKPSTNTWTVSSDERLKTNITLANLETCYNNIKNIPLKRYTWRDEIYSEEQVPDRSKLGWIAQDVEMIFPKAVNKKNMHGINDCRDLNSDQLIATLYGCIQKIIIITEDLNNEVDVLTEELNNLKNN